MSVRGIWGHLTFLVGNVPPKMPPNGGSCSCTALDHAGHCTTASYWITSVLWMLTEQAGSEIGGGGGNRTPVRKPRRRKHRATRRKNKSMKFGSIYKRLIIECYGLSPVVGTIPERFLPSRNVLVSLQLP